MAKTIINTGLDLGSSTIKLLVVAKKENNFEILFKREAPSLGIRKGTVMEPLKASQIINSLLKEAEESINHKIRFVSANINGSHITSVPSHSLISVGRADQKITNEDIDRLLKEIETVSSGPNKEIFQTIIKEFIIDGEKGIKNPIGLQGMRLESDVLLLIGSSPFIKNLETAILKTDIVEEVTDIALAPVSASNACLSERQKEIGTVLIDIGAETTGIVIYEDGKIMHLAILPIGASSITYRIAIDLKIDVEVAEKIKIEYGNLLSSSSKTAKKEKIELGDNESLMFSKKQILKIFETEIRKIFREVGKELKKFGKERMFPGGVVLVGGGAKTARAVDWAKKELKLPVRIGRPSVFDIEDPSFAAVAGLVLSQFKGSETEDIDFSTEKKGWFEKIKTFFSNFIP